MGTGLPEYLIEEAMVNFRWARGIQCFAHSVAASVVIYDSCVYRVEPHLQDSMRLF
jgi:hypothetical protein